MKSERGRGNPYDVLGLTKDASADEVKKRYRKLAKEFHPDKISKSASSEEMGQCTKRFQEIQHAYDTLSDPMFSQWSLSVSAKTPALHLAAERGNLAEVVVLVQNGEIDERDSTDRTALMRAASNGHTRVVEYLTTLLIRLS